MDKSEHLLAGLDLQQQKVVLSTEGPVLVFAGAGSGKTRSIIHRTAYLLSALGVPPWKVLIVTFTNKAAKELRTRLSQHFAINLHSFWVGTFHSICARILRNEASEYRLPFSSNFTIIDQDDQKSIIKKIYKDLNIDRDSFPLSSIRNIISQSKNSLITPDNFFEFHPRSIYTVPVEKIYSEYHKRLRSNNCLDFDDLLMETAILLRDNERVKKKYNDIFDYIMIDEYQDTNYAQFKLVYLLTGKHNNICAVGDDDQAIYSWRGASIKNILNFSKDFADATVIRLEQNYRSTQPILDLANRLISCNSNRHPKKLWTERKEGAKPLLQVYENEMDEAAYTIKSIVALFPKMAVDESSVVLYRTNAQSRAFESKCLEMGVPYKIHGAIAFFQRKEIKDIVAYLRIITNPGDSESLLRIINFPPRGIGTTTINKIIDHACLNHTCLMEALTDSENILTANKSTRIKISLLAKLISDLTDIAHKQPLLDLLDYLYKELDIIKFYEKSTDIKDITRSENIKEFRAAAEEFSDSFYRETNQNAKLEDFLNNISLYTNVDTENSGDDETNTHHRVNLMTLHNAKGLEFDYVYIAGIEEMLLPHKLSVNSPDEIEEERRLLYVGITRAKQRIFLSYTRYRRGIYGYENSLPSRFIRELFPQNSHLERPVPLKQEKHYSSSNSGGHDSPTRATRDKADNVFRIGQRIEHKDFGIGTILNIDGTGLNAKLTICFESGNLKKIVASYIHILTD